MGVAMRCDGCERVEPSQPAKGSTPVALPPGWLSVALSPTGQRGDFCGHECASLWVLEQGDVEAAAVAIDPEQFGTPVTEWSADTWKAFGHAHGVPGAHILKHARELASERRVANPPRSLADLGRFEALASAVRTWVLEVEAVSARAS